MGGAPGATAGAAPRPSAPPLPRRVTHACVRTCVVRARRRGELRAAWRGPGSAGRRQQQRAAEPEQLERGPGFPGAHGRHHGFPVGQAHRAGCEDGAARGAAGRGGGRPRPPRRAGAARCRPGQARPVGSSRGRECSSAARGFPGRAGPDGPRRPQPGVGAPAREVQRPSPLLAAPVCPGG